MKTYLSREEMIQDLVKPGDIGAEIGVYRGGFSRKLLECNVAHLFAIDAWTVYDAYAKDSLCHTNQDDNWQATKNELATWIDAGKCTVIKGYSADVAKTWDKPLDFFFLDSIHTEPFVYQDLENWSRFVKPGGVIMCHDFTERPAALAMDFAVVKSVLDFCTLWGWEVFAVTQEPDWPSCAIRRKA